MFMYLYTSIVIAIICLGFTLDRIWRDGDIEYTPSLLELSFLQIIEERIHATIKTAQDDIDVALNNEIDQLSLLLPVSIALFSIDDLASSNAFASIFDSDHVHIASQNNTLYFYKHIVGSQYVMRVMALDSGSETTTFNIFILIFYAGLALVIYVLIMPLSRDLKKIQQQTAQMNKAGMPSKVDIGKSSLVFPLANAYNLMVERLIASMNCQKEMTSAISHELRTPLARMKFALEMLYNNADKYKGDGSTSNNSVLSTNVTLERLTGLKKDVTEMDELISTLLNYATFEQDKALEITSGNLFELVSSCVNNLKLHTRFVTSIHKSGDVTSVYCDWRLMEIVVVNLLKNVQRFADKTVFISVGFVDNLGDKYYYFSIEDDGPGIPEAQRETIFDPFIRLNNEVSSYMISANKSGFGLGLALVKRIVEWHNGRVYVEACAEEQGNQAGARFTVRWPCFTDQAIIDQLKNNRY